MEKFTSLTAVAAPLPRINIDTDAIIPIRFLVSITKTGYGRGLFGGWRYLPPDDRENPDFVLNRPEYRGAKIIVAGANYGCGSSREMAVWAHLDHGIRAVIAPSFASIFHGNAFKSGLLPVTLPDAVVADILTQLERRPGAEMTVDLVACTVTAPDGGIHPFTIDGPRREALLAGLDEIGLTLQHAGLIAAFQTRDRTDRPWVWR